MCLGLDLMLMPNLLAVELYLSQIKLEHDNACQLVAEQIFYAQWQRLDKFCTCPSASPD